MNSTAKARNSRHNYSVTTILQQHRALERIWSLRHTTRYVGSVGSKLGNVLSTTVNAETAATDRRGIATEIQEQYRQSKIDFLHRHILQYQALFRKMEALSSGDSYLFLDDLYHIRRTDQPQVIDYFHRIAKGSNLWLKIGTIRHRTSWYLHGDPPVGVKLGDDADEIDLDLTLEKYSLAKEFLTKVLRSFVNDCVGLTSSQILNEGAMDRLVLASRLSQ